MASAAHHRRDNGTRSDAPPVTLTLAPLGVPLVVEIVGAGQPEAVAAACRRWQGTAGSGSPLHLRIEAGGAGEEAGAIRIAIDGAVMHVRGGGVYGAADPLTRRAWCRVPERFLASPDLLRSEILEPLVLCLLGRSDRAPVHAACFLADGLAVLLAGRSGSGKSSLAFAADAGGFPVLSEDVAYVQLRPRLRVWGWPGPVHLLPSSAPRGGTFPTRVRNGKTKLVVPLAAAAGAPSHARMVFCLLERGDAVALERISSDTAMRRLAPLEPGFDTLATEVGAAHAALTRNGAWQLTLSADPGEAIRFVAANLARLRDTAVP